jgi:hypothetical protein
VALAGKGARATYAIDPGATLLAADLGVRRGESGAAAVRFTLDGKPVALHTVTAGAPPQRVVVNIRAARRLTMEVAGGEAVVVLGNPRLYTR